MRLTCVCETERAFHVCIAMKKRTSILTSKQKGRRRQKISYRLSTPLNQVGEIPFTSSIISFASNPSFTHYECPPSLIPHFAHLISYCTSLFSFVRTWGFFFFYSKPLNWKWGKKRFLWSHFVCQKLSKASAWDHLAKLYF